MLTRNCQLDILLPSDSSQSFQSTIASDQNILHYARLHMKPLDLITGSFFTTYIKTPGPKNKELSMLSQGRPGLDTTLTLISGILRIETDKATFERMGLQGSSVPSEGRKHVKARYLVILNLRLPSMVSGKPGFERVKWAFKNVLNDTLTWLVCGADAEGPIKDFQPVMRDVQAEVEELKDILTPKFPGEVDNEEAAEMLEWSSLVLAASPRVHKDDDVDAYLSRYQVSNEPTCQNLSRYCWRGLISPDFAYKRFLSALKASGDNWVIISAASFSGEGYTIMVHDGQALSWEYKD